MTTNKILYEKEFFHFDTDKVVTSSNSRVKNPRTNTSLRIGINNGKTELHKILTAKYDLEIFPLLDPADVFCNIKTIMTWDFEIEKNQDLGSLQFSEALLHNVLNQVHFASMLLRQNFVMDFATTADLLHKPNVVNIHKQMKEQLTFLADLRLTGDYPFLFSYWY
jgi:hypothetical protein